MAIIKDTARTKGTYERCLTYRCKKKGLHDITIHVDTTQGSFFVVNGKICEDCYKILRK